MGRRGKKPAKIFFNSEKSVETEGWSWLNDSEKNKAMNKACAAHNRDPELWSNFTSFTRLESASDYAFIIPKSTCNDSYNRYHMCN